MEKKRVFLGGTCNESTWRDILIKLIKPYIEYFNPVVDNWTEEAYQNEMREKEIDDFQLYVITPKMTGVFSIAEAVDASNKVPDKTIFCVLLQDDDKVFTEGQMKSLEKVGEMIDANGGHYFTNLYETAIYLIANCDYSITNI